MANDKIVPEAFADGMINWETLKDVLAPCLEDESEDGEHFGLNWPGKRQARRLASMPSKGTLTPAPGEGVDEETTHEFSLLGFAVSITRSVYAIEVSVVRDRISRSVS